MAKIKWIKGSEHQSAGAVKAVCGQAYNPAEYAHRDSDFDSKDAPFSRSGDFRIRDCLVRCGGRHQ
jgi:hypothetical protein